MNAINFVLVLSKASSIDTSLGVLELKIKWHFPGLVLRLYWNQQNNFPEINFNLDIIVWL